MKPSKLLSEERLLEQAIAVLMDTLGPVETARFLALSMQKRTESVKRHQVWQSKLDKDRFFTDVFGSEP